MTSVTKSLTRETAVLYKRRPLIVTVEPRCLTIREKGRRDRVSVSFDAIYELGLKRRAQVEQAEKRAAKKGRFK